MNEVENQLSELLKKAIEVAEKTGEFAIEQAPLLLQEFYRWHIMKSCLGILLSVLLFVLAVIVVKMIGSKKSFKEYGKKAYCFFGRYYGMDSTFAAVITGGLMAVSSIIIISINIYKLVFIITAPKLYLIEYFIN